jgi:GTP:adenosylcobinamide-phosphate guanylyltransferase
MLNDECPGDAAMDSVLLAGGRLPDDLARRIDTPHKALIPHENRPVVLWVRDALRASGFVARIAVAGPGELGQISEIADADLFMPESDSAESNLFTVFARLLPEGRILIASCDTPLITAESLDDFIGRSAPEAAVNIPVVRYELFLRRFPRATVTPIQLKDGNWIPGDCAVIHSRSIPRLQRILPAVFHRRADVRDIIGLLGWQFALKVKMKRVTLSEVEERLCDAAELPIRLVRDCDPSLAFDIDTISDYDYLRRWADSRTSGLPTRV